MNQLEVLEGKEIEKYYSWETLNEEDQSFSRLRVANFMLRDNIRSPRFGCSAMFPRQLNNHIL